MAKAKATYTSSAGTDRDDAALKAALEAIAERSADAKAKGRAALDGLLAMGPALFERYSGQDTETIQRLAALCNGYLKSGDDKQFPSVKAFLVHAARIPTTTDGEPNKAEYERIRQAWMHDVRQGKKFAAGGKKKRGGKRPYTLAKALQAVETIFKRLKSETDIDQVYRVMTQRYCKATGQPVPEQYQDKAAA